jgi:hypothetical protein
MKKWYKLLSGATKLSIPNVLSMKLGERLGYEPLLRLFNVDKVLRNGRPEMIAWRSRRMDNYVRRQQVRLMRLQEKGDATAYWKLADHLMRSSKAFRMLALRNVRPNWYKDTSWEKVMRWLHELNGICYRPPECFKISRTAIPKDDGSLRWINDPGVAWRCYLWLQNLMVHYFVNPRLYENQHGHRMGKGSVTCWTQIIKHVLPSKFIYEFDYKKFHDLIDRKWMCEALLRFGFPEEVARRLAHLSSPYVTGADERDPLRLKLFGEDEMKFHHYYRGVIQGSNIAALLGLLMLEDLKVYYLSKGKYIGYADDGILYGDDPEVVDEWLSRLNPAAGIFPKPEKSGWVKKDGMWLKELKFIGLRYDPSVDSLFASTHSGKTTEMKWKVGDNVNPEELVAAENWIQENPGGYSKEKVFSTKILSYHNGMAYLGILSSLVWGGKKVGYYRPTSTRVLNYSTGSLIDILMKAKMSITESLDIVNASTLAYIAMAEHLSGYDYFRKPRKSKPNKPGTGQRVFLGGLIRPTSTPNHLGGDNPSLPVKMDLLPTDSKEPTPRWLTVGSHTLTGMGEDYLVLERFMQDQMPDKEMFQFDLECILPGTYSYGKRKPLGDYGPSIQIYDGPNDPLGNVMADLIRNSNQTV